jgi:hypothetical protein
LALIPAKAGIHQPMKNPELDPRLRGDERVVAVYDSGTLPT